MLFVETGSYSAYVFMHCSQFGTKQSNSWLQTLNDLFTVLFVMNKYGRIIQF